MKIRTMLAVVTALALAALLAVAQDKEPQQEQAEQEQQAQAGDTLKVGDPAPKLHVSKWINGEGVEKFKEGKVYVIDFWATWCGPCRAAMPHLADLQEKYKDKGVVVIGMNVWENNPDAVEPFVKRMGEDMNFLVAMDVAEGRKGETAKAWMEAAGQNGIPCTFVVDKKGHVAWIGHPMAGLDRVVDQVVTDKFDAKKEAERLAKSEALQQKLQQAFQNQDWDTALKLFDEFAELQPEMFGRIAMTKFGILMVQKNDPEGAYKYIKQAYEGKLKDDAEVLGTIAWVILTEDQIKTKDKDLALKFAKRANELTEGKDASVLDTLARAHAEYGQLDKAIEVQTKAVAAAPNDQAKAELTQTLEDYKKKATPAPE